MELEAAVRTAERLRRLLQPYCQRIEIAGSVRRRRLQVKDIELVCVPNMIDKPGSLLPEAAEQVSALDCYLRTMTEASTSVAKDNLRSPAWGPRYKKLRYEGAAVDLFIVLPPAEWGLIYFLRTGPSDWSRLAVTVRSKGGWLPDSLAVAEGHIRESGVGGQESGRVIHTPEEIDVFGVLGMDWVEPQMRGVGIA